MREGEFDDKAQEQADAAAYAESEGAAAQAEADEEAARFALIAAGPDLLALAKGYERYLFSTRNCAYCSSEALLEKVRGVIAKAEGRT